MSSTVIEEGLRARKRAVTQATIEKAAISLALEHGYENTTVEMICEASMVSQRTFFNYFGSKEGVILGAAPAMPAEADLYAFVNGTGANVLGDLVETIATVLANRELDHELYHSRRVVIQRTPELANALMARMAEGQDRLVRLVLSRFSAQGRTNADTPDLEDEAGMVVSLSLGVVHYAMQTWRRDQFSSSPHDLMQKSIALVHRVAGHGSDGNPPAVNTEQSRPKRRNRDSK